MKRHVIYFAALLASLACVSCVGEKLEMASSNCIGASASIAGASQTKSTDEEMDLFNQIITFNEDIKVEEIISEGIESGFEEEVVSKGTITTTRNIGYEDRKGPKYFGMTGYIRNMADLDPEYASTPNPYVSYGIAGRVSGSS